MKILDPILTNLSRPGIVLRTGLTACLGIALATTAFAGKGGGKPGGGDPPPDPEPTPAPVSYVLTWLPGGPDSNRLYDIDSQGVAVGAYKPGDVYEEQFGIICFPDRPQLINLEAMASAHADFPAGWRLKNGFAISNGLVVSGDLEDSVGHRHCYAMQLVDNGPTVDPAVAWFRVFSAADVGGIVAGGATVYDASEQGDLTILVDIDNLDGSVSNRGFVWRAVDGAPSVATVVGPTSFGAINNSRDVLWGGGFGPAIVNADTGVVTALGLYNGELTNAWDISESGMAVGVGRGKSPKQRGQSLDQAVRWINGSWEPIGPSGVSSQAVKVNSAEQILGYAGSQLFLFSDAPDLGYRQMDDLLDATNDAADLLLWNSAAYIDTSRWSHSISDPDGTGFGSICGRRIIDGLERAFILTPIATPQD